MRGDHSAEAKYLEKFQSENPEIAKEYFDMAWINQNKNMGGAIR